MRRLLFVLPVVVFAALAAWLGLGLRHDPRDLPSTLIDKPVPDFALPPLPGHERGLSRADLAGGEVRIVNFFASWCVPCRAEHPLLARLAEREGLAVYGINYKDKPADALGFLARLGDPYRQIGADAAGRVAIDFGVYGVPETFVVDRAGTIRLRFAGPLTPQAVEDTILPLVRELAR